MNLLHTQYTWTNDRLWRKNRQDNPNSTCKGVDLNRNYDDHWAQVSHLIIVWHSLFIFVHCRVAVPIVLAVRPTMVQVLPLSRKHRILLNTLRE